MDNIIIDYAKKEEFKQIVELLNIFFDKEQGFFEKLVPSLYKKGVNTYQNHIVARHNERIIGIAAIKESKCFYNGNSYNFLVIGSLSVMLEYRNQGIMKKLLEFIFNKYKNKVDFFTLSGNYELYKKYGFDYSEKIYKYEFLNGGLINKEYSFDFITENNICLCQEMYEKKSNRVVRDNLLDSFMTWMNVPLLVMNQNQIIGYIIVNFVLKIVEEIYLSDNSCINDVMYSLCKMFNSNMALKMYSYNQDIEKYINYGVNKEEYFEKTIYKINNKNIKEISIPRSDMI